MPDLNLKNNRTQGIMLILLFLFFLTPLVYDKGLVDKYNSPKELYFIILSFLALLYSAIRTWLNKKTFSIGINKMDILMIVFQLLYIVPYLMNQKNFESFNINLSVQISLLIFYFIIRFTWENFKENDQQRSMSYILAVVLIISTILVIYGYIQIINNQLPNATIDNPGPYTNYLGIVLSLAFGALILKQFKKKTTKIAVVIFIIFTLVVIIIAKTRTAWLAIAAGFGFMIYQAYSSKIKSKLKKIKGSVFIPFFAATALIVILIVSGWSMYQLKKSSANGRLLIWKTAIEAITEKPVFGYGAEYFKAARNQSQVNYFKDHWGNQEEKYLADDIDFTFNDFLQITGETGLVGLFILILLLFYLFSVKSDNKVILLMKTGLVVLLVTSMFSYSMQRMSTRVLFIFFIAIINSEFNSEKTLSIKLDNILKKSAGTVLILASLFIMAEVAKSYYFQHKWKTTYTIYQKKEKEKAFIFYNKLYPVLKTDPYFLYNYGTILNLEKMYQPSIKILEECKTKLYDHDVLTFLGNNYKATGDYNKAEQAYLDAVHLIPHKFISRYQLAELYAEIDQKEEALKWAFDILNEEPKIPSKMVDDIKKEMVQLVTKLSTKK